MPLCSTCGNEIASQLSTCPHCGEALVVTTDGSERRASGKVVTVNLKEGLPTVAQALLRLDSALGRSRRDGASVVRLIHGYGSSGTGGKIKDGVRKKLAVLRSTRQIRNVVPGEDYSNTTGMGRSLLGRYHELESDIRTDRSNPGITFVEI